MLGVHFRFVRLRIWTTRLDSGIVSNRRVVVTGGPGAGKTTLLTALAGRGYPCVHNSARAIIQDRLRRGLNARPDPAKFAAAILRMGVGRYRQAPTEADLVFFDRAIPDALCMLTDLGLLSIAEARQSILDYPYFRQVFVAPPWEEIYTTDNERDQRFAEAVRVYRHASGALAGPHDAEPAGRRGWKQHDFGGGNGCATRGILAVGHDERMGDRPSLEQQRPWAPARLANLHADPSVLGEFECRAVEPIA